MEGLEQDSGDSHLALRTRSVGAGEHGSCQHKTHEPGHQHCGTGCRLVVENKERERGASDTQTDGQGEETSAGAW